MVNKVIFKDIGSVDYKVAWDLQEKLFVETFDTKKENTNLEKKIITNNYMLFCEHPHVYTIGKSGNNDNLLISNDELLTKGASVYKINRGGDITYHGPGQLVGYPILDLNNFNLSIKNYVYNLEQVIINVLLSYDIISARVEGATGVWLSADNERVERKICAFGIRVSNLVTMHGFALNVNTDLSYFDNIVPCGLVGKGVTSMQKELNRKIDMSDVKQRILHEMEIMFNMKIE